MTIAYPTIYASDKPLHDLPRVLAKDPYLTSSLLQKAIRRSDVETALCAAMVLHALRGNAIWRRLVVIAFEDVGIGSPTAVVQTVRLATDVAARNNLGGDIPALRHAITTLAKAAKDRCTDYLICSAISRPDLGAAREQCGSSTSGVRLGMVANVDLPLAMRATAVWYLCGLNPRGGGPLDAGDRSGLMRLFSSLGVPTELIEATRAAAKLTREPITLMLPLLWLELAASPTETTVVQSHPGDHSTWHGLPLYTLDKHTRIGKRAVHRLLVEKPELQQQLRSISTRLRSLPG